MLSLLDMMAFISASLLGRRAMVSCPGRWRASDGLDARLDRSGNVGAVRHDGAKFLEQHAERGRALTVGASGLRVLHDDLLVRRLREYEQASDLDAVSFGQSLGA